MLKKTDYNTKISEIEGNIPSDISGLVTKTELNTELKKFDDKSISNASEIISFNNKLKQANTRIDDTEGSISYILGKRFFGHDVQQNYLVFQLMYEYLKRVVVTSNNISTIYIHSWTSKGISNKQIKAPNTSTNNDGVEIRLKFTGDLLRQSRVTYNHGPKVSIFIVYKLNIHTINDDFALKHCLFGAVKITKDKHSDNYVYSGYRIGFTEKGTYSHSDGTNAHNVIILGADSSGSVNNSNKLAGNVLVLEKGVIQKINKQTVYADHTIPTNFTVTDKTFCLSLHYDGLISRLFVNGTKQVVFKAKNSEITAYKMCLRNISTDFSATNTQKTGLHENFMTLV